MKAAAIPVGHTSYKLKFVRKKPLVGKDLCQGYCDYRRRLIVIWENPNRLAMRSCLIHEWLHAIFYELGHEGLAEDHGIIVALEMALMRLRIEVPSL